MVNLVEVQRLLQDALGAVGHLREKQERVLAPGEWLAVEVDDCEGEGDEEVGEVEGGLDGVAVGEGEDGDEAVPEDQRLVDVELRQEEAVEPLDACDLETLQHLRLLREALVQPQVHLPKQLLEFAGVLLPVEQAVWRVFQEKAQEGLKRVVGIAFGDPAEVLAVLIGIRVKNERGDFVHALRVRYFGVGLEVEVDDAGDSIVVVGAVALLGLGEVYFRPSELVLLQDVQLHELDLVLLLEKLAPGLRPHRVLLDQVPQVAVVKGLLPLRVLQQVERVVAGQFLLLQLSRPALVFVALQPLGAFLALDDEVDDMALDELVVVDEVALHEGDPFVLGGRQVAEADLPQQGAHRVVLKDEPVAVVLVVLDGRPALRAHAVPLPVLGGRAALELDHLAGLVGEEGLHRGHVDGLLDEHVVDVAEGEVLALQLAGDAGDAHVVGHVDQRVQDLLLLFRVHQARLVRQAAPAVLPLVVLLALLLAALHPRRLLLLLRTVLVLAQQFREYGLHQQILWRTELGESKVIGRGRAIPRASTPSRLQDQI